MHQRYPGRALTVLFALILAACAWNGLAQPLSVDDKVDPLRREPLWEFGLFNGAVQMPQYSGSDERSTYVVPIPYFVYRGEVIRSGRDGIQGIFYKSEHLQTDLAVSGSPPAPRDNRARAGMPALGAMVEVGPALKYLCLGRESPDALFLRGSVRAAFSFDVYDRMRSDGEGFRSAVDLTYDNRSLFEARHLRFGANLSADFIDARYSDFYYGVAPQYATDSRPSYTARGGYAGLSVSGHATKELGQRVSVSIFAKWINLDHAAFEESPLVKTTDNFVLGCALAWQIGQSGTPAPSAASDDP